jgi:hypothetical protein
MNSVQERSGTQSIVVSVLLLAITLFGVTAHASVMSVLLLLCLGVPALLLLLDTLLGPVAGGIE